MSKGLPRNVKQCLAKSHDSALLAVETYNKPAVTFKTGAFVVLMVIAWTALFHAYFFRKRVKPFLRDKKNPRRYATADGDYVYWDLGRCLSEYYESDTQNPIRKNLEFFIPLRNRIEHKSLPEIDADVFAECQAMLLNYDRVVEKEFGAVYCLRESLSFSLQMFPTADSLGEAVKANRDALNVKKFIDDYRSALSTDVMNSGQYSFKAFLMQVASHQAADALPIQFIRYDNLSDHEKRNVDRIGGLVKFRDRAVSGKDLKIPSKVVKAVQAGLGNIRVNRNGKLIDKFIMDTHTRCWQKYQVRPGTGDPNPSATKEEYCVYDEPSGTYRYTKQWVEFLINKMSDEVEYASLFSKQ